MIDTKLYSGYRIRFQRPDAQAHLWQNLRRTVTGIVPVFEMAAQEPYFLDDSLRGYSLEEVIMQGLQNGEMLVTLYGGNLVMVTALTNITHRRSAHFEIWVHPDFRGKLSGEKITRQAAREIIDYAFAPFDMDETGLGLPKLKADIAALNIPALKGAKNLGFRPTGLSTFDALYHGNLVDNVLLELLNPAFFPVVGSLNSGQKVANAEGANVRATSTVCSATGPAIDSTSSPFPNDGDGAGASGREDATGVVADLQRPDEPAGAGAVQTKLLRAKRGTRARAVNEQPV